MKSWVLGAIVLSVLSGIDTIASANPPVSSSGDRAAEKGELRDEDLMIRHEFVGQCRRTTRMVDIYSMPDTIHGSERVAVLPGNRNLTLTGWGGYGWVEINSPVEGYVIARHITPCSGAARTAPSAAPLSTIVPDTEACRVAVRDLAIRDRPGKGATSIGGVPGSTAMTLTGSTELDNATQRLWVEISAPAEGWVSGGRGGASNLRNCR